MSSLVDTKGIEENRGGKVWCVNDQNFHLKGRKTRIGGGLSTQ